MGMINSKTFANAVSSVNRRLEEMYSGYFGGTTNKHDHKKDFGWPSHVTFEMFYRAYSRNGIARGAVMKTVRKTWEDNPKFIQDETDGTTTVEKALEKQLKKIRFFQKCAEADRRALVGGYSAIILRFADGREFKDPIGEMAGPKSLAGAIVAWAPQLRVAQWDLDRKSPTYGEPLMYQFVENSIADGHASTQSLKARSFDVHPERVIIWSADGTVHCPSILEPGFDDLLDMEKIKGAGGEGFWKNAKAAPVLEIDKDASLREMAATMGTDEEGLLEAVDKQVEDFSKGFDNVLMLQGIQSKPMNIQLASPEKFFMVSLQSFCASVEVPLKIMVGSQSGERASTEDAREWSQTINARRSDSIIPLLEEILRRLEDAQVILGEWKISWTDLTKATLQEKLELAAKMANINSKSDTLKTGEKVFSNAEVREAVGYEENPKVGTLQALPPVEDTNEGDETELNPEGTPNA